jgi:hypothetical protein
MGSKETQEYIHNHNLALQQDEGPKVKLHSTESCKGWGGVKTVVL